MGLNYFPPPKLLYQNSGDFLSIRKGPEQFMRVSHST